MDLDEALRDLLPGGRSGDPEADLRAAVAEVWRRRHRNTELGAAVINALVARVGWSFGRIQRELGIPKGTAHRWAAPPGSTDSADSADSADGTASEA